MLCVGTGRDGTFSLSRMIQAVFDAAGAGQQVVHEYQAAAFYQSFSEWRETGDERDYERLRTLVQACPADCIVGNGYAAALPIFAQQFGRKLTIVHLRRINRDACLRSLVENCELFPGGYGYYSDAPNAVCKRMAAFHFQEMTQAEWGRLALIDKMAWYYDKTHQLIDASRHLFDTWIDLTTETLDDSDTRQMIARLATGREGFQAPRVHMNLHRLDLARVPPDERPRLFQLIGRLDVQRLRHDDLYLLEHTLAHLESWISWCAHGHAAPYDLGSASSPEVLAARLEQIQQMVGAFGDQVAQYQAILRGRTAGTASADNGTTQRGDTNDIPVEPGGG
jgi:hypothetical protein